MNHITDQLADVIASNISKLMKARGTNPRALALKAGKSHTVVRDILSGKSKHPQIDTLESIAAALDTTVLAITTPETSGTDITRASELSDQLLQVFDLLSDRDRKILLTQARAYLPTDE